MVSHLKIEVGNIETWKNNEDKAQNIGNKGRELIIS